MTPSLRELLDLVAGLDESPENWQAVRRLQDLRRTIEQEVTA